MGSPQRSPGFYPCCVALGASATVKRRAKPSGSGSVFSRIVGCWLLTLVPRFLCLSFPLSLSTRSWQWAQENGSQHRGSTNGQTCLLRVQCHCHPDNDPHPTEKGNPWDLVQVQMGLRQGSETVIGEGATDLQPVPGRLTEEGDRASPETRSRWLIGRTTRHHYPCQTT